MPMDLFQLISDESGGNYNPVKVITVHKPFGTASRPVLVTCDDAEQYVIKGSQNGKMVYNEYVCGRLGNLLAAPVAWVRFVEIDPTLKAADPHLAGFGPGLAIGSLRIPRASDRAGVQHADIPQNRAGFAGLAILYSWVKANDHQFIYQEVPPQLVYSNDHGHFFPTGPNWTKATLKAEPNVVRDSYFDVCALTAAELMPFWKLLKAITDDDIRKICSAPPAAWGVATDEREAAADYLIDRRDKVEPAF